MKTIKIIDGIRYTIYYNYYKNYLYPVTFQVKIIKATYKIIDKRKSNIILSNLKLRSVIEQDLYLPVI
jgi:hypothetical protein